MIKEKRPLFFHDHRLKLSGVRSNNGREHAMSLLEGILDLDDEDDILDGSTKKRTNKPCAVPTALMWPDPRNWLVLRLATLSNQLLLAAMYIDFNILHTVTISDTTRISVWSVESHMKAPRSETME